MLMLGARVARAGASLTMQMPSLRSATGLRLRARMASASASASGSEYFGPLSVVDGVALVRLDGPDKVNTISPRMQEEAIQLWEQEIVPRHRNGDVKAVVFISSKKDNFIAGADIKMIKGTKDKTELKRIIEDGHRHFAEMKQLGIPLVSAINGSCLGGGLEWALYCDYRIASTNPKTALGLPEVMLGLLPGLGGTWHLPRLVGYQAALPMLLTGKQIRADRAKKMGLVDQIVDPYALETVAVDMARQLADGTLKPKRKPRSWMDWFLEATPFGRKMMFDKATAMVRKNAKDFYQAPYKILEILQSGMDMRREEYLDTEANGFVELAQTSTSEALIGIFEGQTALKKNRFGDPPRPIRTVGVLGAGLMGAGIAQISTDKGLRVLLKDKDMAGMSRGEQYVSDNFMKKVKRRRMTKYKYNQAMSRIIPLHDGTPNWQGHMQKADLVIEAVFEELNVKHRVIQEIEPLVSENCVIATNTSAIPIADIAAGASRPENIVGMHYFSPVPLMPLIEIIRHEGTSDEAAAIAVAVGIKQGKTPLIVKDVEGFFINRCLGPMMVESFALVKEGVGLEQLDKAMLNFGMPVGPVTLVDEVGVDVSQHVQESLARSNMGVRLAGADSTVVDSMVEKGWLGRKSGKGFYMYDGKSKSKPLNPEVVALVKQYQEGASSTLAEDDIQYRMIGRFINEAAFCLQDDIIDNPVDGDMGAIFGIGFPPFLGGPFRHVDTIGVSNFVDRMSRYADSYGEQFTPCPLLVDMANANKRFHPE